jgi:hypothetical protein
VQPTIIRGYDGGITVGQREAFVLTGSGPTSYSNIGSSSGTGDLITPPFGIYLDVVTPILTKSGTFYLIPFPSAVNTTRATWAFRWFTTATMAEVGNGTNLSAESVQFLALGGNF